MPKGRRGRCGVKNLAGIGLMATGILVLICNMPFWAWLFLLGTVLIITGVFCVWG